MSGGGKKVSCGVLRLLAVFFGNEASCVTGGRGGNSLPDIRPDCCATPLADEASLRDLALKGRAYGLADLAGAADSGKEKSLGAAGWHLGSPLKRKGLSGTLRALGLCKRGGKDIAGQL